MDRQPNIESLSEIYGRVKDNVEHRTVRPLYPFGIVAIDEISRGFPKGKVTIISARTSEGKTSMAMQSAIHLANMGKNVMIVSLEDDREMLVEKSLCNIFEIDNYELHKGRVGYLNEHEDTIQRLFKRLKLVAVDNYGYTFSEFKDVVINTLPRPDVVFFDYVQLIEYPAGMQYDYVSNFIRQSHKLAMEEGIAVVIISQINRGAAEARRPSLHHLQGSGAIEQVAYLVLILHQCCKHGDHSYDYDKRAGTGMEHPPMDYVEAMIEKSKVGRTGIVPLRFIGRNYRFKEWIL